MKLYIDLLERKAKRGERGVENNRLDYFCSLIMPLLIILYILFLLIPNFSAT